MRQRRNVVLDQMARGMRKDSTLAEQCLWRQLRNRRLQGLKFRRQQRLGPYIADFYCHELGLVVEVDGGVHDLDSQRARDENRDFVMRELGLKVLRIRNEEILEDPQGALNRIRGVATTG